MLKLSSQSSEIKLELMEMQDDLSLKLQHKLHSAVELWRQVSDCKHKYKHKDKDVFISWRELVLHMLMTQTNMSYSTD